MTLPVGERIGGRFEVEGLLGEGGTARVYRVRHTTLGSVQAVKFLEPGSGGTVARLLQEGRIQARLRHPCVVPVVDVVEHQGMTGLLMEYVHGPSLADVLTQGRLSREEALELFARILAGVGAAHRFGVLHRDLKPHNVLLEPHTGGWMPKVADFGIARALDPAAGPRQTRVGFGIGTPGYMAPEVVWGTSEPDGRADVYGLGVVLFELITGTLPAAVAPGVAPPDPSAAGAALGGGTVGEAVVRALQLDPGERLPDVEALARALYADRPDLLAIATGAAIPTPVHLAGEFTARALDDAPPTGGTLVAEADGPAGATIGLPVGFTAPTGNNGPAAGARPSRFLAWFPIVGGALLLGIGVIGATWLSQRTPPADAPAGPDAPVAALPEPSAPTGAPSGAASAPVPSPEGLDTPAGLDTPDGPGTPVAGTPGLPASASAGSAAPPAGSTLGSPVGDTPGAPLADATAAPGEPAGGSATPPTDAMASAAAATGAVDPTTPPGGTASEATAVSTLGSTPAAAPEAPVIPDVRGRYAGTAAGRPMELRIVSQDEGRVVAQLTILLGTTERSARYTGMVTPDGRVTLAEDSGSGRMDVRLSGGDVSGTFSSGGGKPLAVKARKD